MKTGVYILYQRHEFEKARCFLASTAPQLQPDIQLYLLINDSDCSAIRDVAAGLSPFINVVCAGSNLGVASGRNLIIRKALDEGVEFLVSCDTDIIFESRYFENIRAEYSKIMALDEKVGLLQPVLFNGPDVASCFCSLSGAVDWRDLGEKIPLDADIRRPFWSVIRNHLGGSDGVKAIMHAGVSNLWVAHFGSDIDKSILPENQRNDSFLTSATRSPTLRSEPEQLLTILDAGTTIRISSTAGGISAFHRELFLKAGGYDEIFSPFGFEDSEFGFRTTLLGFHHYLVSNCAGIHDIFVSGQSRTAAHAARIGLLRGVEAGGKGLSNEQRSFAIRQSIFFGLRQLVNKFSKESKKRPAELPELQRIFPNVVFSYAFEFLRGFVHAVFRDRTETLSSVVKLLKPGDAEFQNFELMVDKDVFIVSRKIVKKGEFPISEGQTFSLHATDCHIREGKLDSALRSRFSDLLVRITHVGDKRFLIKCDALSHDVLLKLVAEVSVDLVNAPRDGAITIKSFDVFSKKHNYGNFSSEDIYPSPTLWQSADWKLLVLEKLQAINAIDENFAFAKLTELFQKYLSFGVMSQSKTNDIRIIGQRDEETQVPPKKRILIFTDSRGQHKPAGQTHQVFAERLAADPQFDVDIFLCPMKWTTTLDFLEQFPLDRLAQYDHVILYTGIVEWSPRPAPSARIDLYDNQTSANRYNLGLNTRDYAQKVVNNKKAIFDSVFGAESMAMHLAHTFDTLYEGQLTINMYSLDMAREKLIPILAAIPNLIFVTSNRFVPGWEGDFKRGRPENIAICERYSDLFATELARAGVTLVDLRKWNLDEVKVYTCDNMHLTKHGSEFIYERLMQLISTSPTAKHSSVNFGVPEYTFSGFGPIERVVGAKRAAVVASAECKDPTLASLIIGVRYHPNKPLRIKNLNFLLQWIDHYYGDLFDVLLLEQDSEPRLPLATLGAKPYVRHVFAYNPQDYNRGWGYNVAVRHHCREAKVVVLMDTDVLTGPNFLRDVMDCHHLIDVASPYLNIYYTDKDEARQVFDTISLSHLDNPSRIKNPVTVSGGIVIWNRAAYMGIKGFEQYVGYSCEDRAMDVTIFNHINKERIRISPQTYVHLHHDIDRAARSRFEDIFSHLTEHYACSYDKTLSPYDFIHKNCRHVHREKTLSLMLARSRDFGDPDLYRSGDKLAINGVRLEDEPVSRLEGVIFPPDFKGLSDYPAREVYANTPDPDTSELAQFYNRFKGQRCFIIGNGPSLNCHELKLLENEFSFGVNSFYYKTRETGFRPTFYVVEDSSVMKENIEQIRAYEAPFKFFPTIYSKLHPKTPNTFFFNMNRGFYEKSSPNYAVPRFSTDASRVLYCGQSVTYINLQLAFFMGFTEVYLIGMDFDYIIPDSHKRTGDVLLSDSDDPNHFHKDYFGKGKTWKDPKLERVLMNYRMADLAYNAVGRKIYNATVGGKLELFERVDYEKLLSTPVKTKNVSLKDTIQVNKPEASQSFSFVSPNCWTFTKSLNSDKQKQLIFPANPPCPTKDREFLAVAILETNVYSEVEVSLGRHSSGAYEGKAAKIRLGAGQSTPVIICHKFISNHEKIKFQLKILCCAGDSAEVKVCEQFIFQSPESMVASLDKGEDIFALANSRFREAHYLESAPLYLHLAHQKPNISFYQEMAKSALELAGIQSVKLRENMLANFI